MSDEGRRASNNLYPTLPPHQNDLNKAENGSALQNGKNSSTGIENRHHNYDNHHYSNDFSNNPEGGLGTGETKDYRYFWNRVLKDLTNKDLIPVKILFFFKFATLFVLYPFLTLHMHALGLNEWEIGVNQASVPIVAIFGPPVSGVIADRIGNFKVVLSVITLINAAVALLLLLVPVARETVRLPTNITFEMDCDPSTHNFILKSVDPSLCSLTSNHWNSSPDLKRNVLHCGQICRNDRSNDSNITGSNDKNFLFFPPFPIHGFRSNFSIAMDNKTYMFYPSVGNRPSFKCQTHDNGNGSGGSLSQECSLVTSYDIADSEDASDFMTTTMGQPIPNLEKQSYSIIGLAQLSLVTGNDNERNNSAWNANSTFTKNQNVTRPELLVGGPITFDGNVHDSPTCTGGGNQNSQKSISEDGHINEECMTKCFVQLKRKLICSNDSERRVYDVPLTFAIYTLFRLLLGFASATSFIMFEGAVLAILKQYGGDYGLQRVSATFAAIIAAPSSGYLLKYYSFQPVFYLYAALQAFSALLTLKIDLKFKKPSENILTHLKEVLSQAEILIFFLAMLVSGTAWGYLETFLFLFLKELGGSEILMGLTISVGGLFGLPFLIFSRPLIKRVGHVNILCIGLLFYGVRYFGYSVIEDPWLCLPFEAMESITASLAITAAATYAVALSSLQTIATVQGIMGALYFGIGRGTGSFLGGVLIREFGHRQTFQIMGMGSFLASVLYMLVNVLYIRRHTKTKTSSDTNLNHMNGLVISNGSAKMKGGNSTPNPETKDQFQMKPQNHDSDLGYGKVNPGFEEGEFEDGNKFTDIPLDEDNQSTLPHNNNRKK